MTTDNDSLADMFSDSDKLDYILFKFRELQNRIANCEDGLSAILLGDQKRFKDSQDAADDDKIETLVGGKK